MHDARTALASVLANPAIWRGGDCAPEPAAVPSGFALLAAALGRRRARRPHVRRTVAASRPAGPSGVGRAAARAVAARGTPCRAGGQAPRRRARAAAAARRWRAAVAAVVARRRRANVE